jgi:uncharacterized membrane protein YiaA
VTNKYRKKKCERTDGLKNFTKIKQQITMKITAVILILGLLNAALFFNQSVLSQFCFSKFDVRLFIITTCVSGY